MDFIWLLYVMCYLFVMCYAPWLSDQLEWVLCYAPWLSDQLEWICGMLHGLVINWSSSAIETSRNRVNGHDLDLWGDLRMIFDPNEEDDIWLNQQYWELLRWKLHEYSGVHSLFLDGTSIQINMLVEKKYPLKKAILEKMINLKIEAEEDSNMAIELIKFIKSQIAEQS
ncbi:hypothetical protein Tco_1516648 [Tanacetum coccineum]